MSYIQSYYKVISEILQKVFGTQADAMRLSAEKLTDTVISGGRVYIFGCTHAGILAQEAFYRTGGLAVINPIFPPGLTCDIVPITLTSKLERDNTYGSMIADEYKLNSGDLLIIHSVSGRNSVPVDLAAAARKKGVFVIAITSLEYSRASKSRSESGLNLYQCADIVIDNCGEFGDAAVQIDGFEQKVSPTSTVSGAAILNAIVAESAGIFMERGITPPVFLSANIDGGDAKNAELLKKYKDRITYI